jgi:hypothetical protein
MIDETTDRPDCFGHLDTVFPMGEEGFRTTPPACMKCPLVKCCIQAAMKTPDGLRQEEERIDRAYECGLIGTLERWSKKKVIHQKIKDQTSKAKSKQLK